MLTLTLTAMTLSLTPEADLSKSQELQLEIPRAYYLQSDSRDEWLNNIYKAALEPAKEYELKTQEETNIYNAYLGDYYTEEDIAFFNEAMGRRPYQLTLHTRAWEGDSSGFAQGFSLLQLFANQIF